MRIFKCEACRSDCGFEMNSIPEEILLMIFSRLPYIDRVRIERVCRRWQRRSRLSWRTMQRLIVAEILNDYVFLDVRDPNRVLVGLLQRTGPFLKALNLSESIFTTELSRKSFKFIGRYCPQLTSLNLSYIQLTNAQLIILAAECQQIERLWLVRCFDDEESPDDGLATLFHNLSGLTVLDISLNETINGECLRYIHHSSLRHLIANRIPVTYNSMRQLSRNCPGIRHLSIKNSCISLHFLQALFGLEVLELDFYTGPTDFSLILPSLQHLKRLNLSHSILVTDPVLQRLPASIEYLNLSGRFGVKSGTTLHSLPAQLPALSEIDLNWLEHLGSLDAKSLIQKAVPCVLRQIHAHLCDGLSPGDVLGILNHFPCLETIDLTGCHFVDPQFIRDAQETIRKQFKRKIRSEACNLLITNKNPDSPPILNVKINTE